MPDDKLLRKYITEHPGVAVVAASITPNGIERTYHNADENTRFEIGSITKVFTGILLCEAVQDGLCERNTPLSQIFGKQAPKGRPITLGQLATHTSTLPRLPLALYRTASSPQPYATWDRPKILHALSRSTAQLYIRPGGAYAYSNFGFAVLGLAIETLQARPYEELIGDLTARLGCPEITLKRNDMAKGRGSKGQEVPPWQMAAFAPAGALASNLEGMIKFARRSLSPLNAPGLAESMTDRTIAEKSPGFRAAATMAAITTLLALADPHSFVPLVAIGYAAYLGGAPFGLIPSVAWGLASLASGAPGYLAAEQFGIGLVGTGLAQTLRRKTAIQEIAIAWHVSRKDGREILWHNGGTGGFRAFLGIVPATGTASIVLAACEDSVDSVGLALLAG